MPTIQEAKDEYKKLIMIEAQTVCNIIDQLDDKNPMILALVCDTMVMSGVRLQVLASLNKENLNPGGYNDEKMLYALTKNYKLMRRAWKEKHKQMEKQVAANSITYDTEQKEINHDYIAVVKEAPNNDGQIIG